MDDNNRTKRTLNNNQSPACCYNEENAISRVATGDKESQLSNLRSDFSVFTDNVSLSQTPI